MSPLAEQRGKLIEHSTGPAIISDQKMLAVDLVPALNKHLHR